MKATPNAMPLTRPQWAALGAAAARELVWGLRAVSREVERWRLCATSIRDPALRRDALDALALKRGHIDGAAFFWTLLDRRDLSLLRTLVAYEVLLDYLDGVSERKAHLGADVGRRLFQTAGCALDLQRPWCERSLRASGCDDGGYGLSLVAVCRDGCRALPSYDVVRPLLTREAERAAVLGLNHEPDPVARTALLRAWADAELPGTREMPWYEQTAAASGWLMTHVLLALAAEPALTREVAERVYAAYFPWVGLTVTMLDSYVDQAEDVRDGAHSYISYYRCPEAAVARLRESVERAVRDVLALPHGERHAVLLGCMVALYLSKDSARTPELRATTASIAAAGGSLTRLLLPILRVWRICNAQRSAT